MFSPSTYFSLKVRRRYEFIVGQTERVAVEIYRTRWFPALRRRKFLVFVNDVLTAEFRGY